MSNELEVLAGEVPMTARFLDGTETTVPVRYVRIRQMPEFLLAMDEEAGLIEYCCGQEQGWADNLTEESHLVLLEKAKEINFSRAVAWAERQLARRENLPPLLSRTMRQGSPSGS